MNLWWGIARGAAEASFAANVLMLSWERARLNGNHGHPGDSRSRTGICMRGVRPKVGSFAGRHRMLAAMKTSSDTSIGARV
jgi:hypothetical protein